MWSIFFMLMLLVSVADSCRFGPDSNCAFPCRCRGAHQCDSQTGACLYSKCQRSQPVGYGWRGPGCLVGNIAFNKQAYQSGQYGFYSADLAVDGDTNPYITVSQGESCAHPLTSQETYAWWWVDLGGLYNILSITIINRLAAPSTTQPQERFNKISTDYDINIGNTSDISEHKLCYNQTKLAEQIKSVETMQCLSGDMTGRYVSFTRNGGKDRNIAAICEFIVMGNAIIECDSNSCSGKCDSILGCDQCAAGQMLPDCNRACPDGYWGENCAYQCGKCRDGAVCDKVTGSCGNQCDGWYIPELCNKILEYPPHTVNQMSTYITSNSVRLSWDTSPWFFSDYQQLFYYIVVHRHTNSTSETWDTSDRIPFSNETSFLYDISGLTYNTEYEAQVVSYRELNGMTDRGYIQTTEFKTLCTEPTIEETPVIIGSTDVFKIKWESVAIEIGCVYIINQQISIECHNSTHATNETLDIPINDKSFLYSAEYASRCYVRLLITNNAGLSASGMPVTVSDYSKTTMINEYQSTMFPPADDTSNTSHSINGAAITIGVVAMVVILVMAVVITGLVIRLRSSNGVSSENIYANGFNTKEIGLNEDTGAINPAYKENVDGEESDIQQFSVYEPLGNDRHDADTNTQGTVYASLEDQIKELRSSEISGTSSSDDSDVYENTKIVESAHGRVNDLGRTPSEYMVMK